jgi:hypothetical protein
MCERLEHRGEDGRCRKAVGVRRLSLVFFVAILVVVSLRPLEAAEPTVESLLPESCVTGWIKEGKISTYASDDLYKYIDGEAELYLPYGFERAATVMYAKPDGRGNGVVVNIFEMGSLLDAFGIYGNYRAAGTEPVKLGAEGFVEETQVMFYQGRYFVQIMTSGNAAEEPSLFLACAATVSKNMPGGAEKPRELDLLNVSGLLPSTERYYAGGLLGYGFFGRGLTGEVMLKNSRAKAFVLFGDSDTAIKQAVEAYVKQLKGSKAAVEVSQEKGGLRLGTTDPLYKGVLLRQSGRYAVGVAGLADPRDGEGLVAQLIERLPK